MLNFCLDLKDKEQIMPNNIETEHKNIFVIGGYLSYKFHSSVFPMLRFPCMVFVNKSEALKYVPFIRTMTMTRWSICSNSLSHHRAIDVLHMRCLQENEYSWYKALSDYSFIFRVFKTWFIDLLTQSKNSFIFLPLGVNLEF